MRVETQRGAKTCVLRPKRTGPVLAHEKHRARVANGQQTFATTKWALAGSYANQIVPINVAQVCAWTLMCTMNDIHANDAGHAALAGAFEPQIAKALASP